MDDNIEIDPSAFTSSEVYLSNNVESSESIDQEKPHILVLINGIRTEADWVNRIIENGILTGRFKAVPLYYGKVSTRVFLTGTVKFPIFVSLIEDMKAIISSYPNHNISVFCHSFGTKMFCDILKFIDYRFYFVFFSGGVVRANAACFVPDKCNYFINDCSTKDFWPRMATKINKELYEASGTNGFRKHFVNDRYFNYSHSDYLTDKHFNQYIIPSIVSGAVYRLRHKYANPDRNIKTFLVNIIKNPFYIVLMSFIIAFFTLLILKNYPQIRL